MVEAAHGVLLCGACLGYESVGDAHWSHCYRRRVGGEPFCHGAGEASGGTAVLDGYHGAAGGATFSSMEVSMGFMNCMS